MITQEPIGKQTLNPDELQEAKQLAAVCNAHESLELKLGLDAPAPISGDELNNFLYYDNGALIGYCSVDDGEICGMVHPAHRRKGIATALLEAAIAECKRRNLDERLIICERASRSGQSFVAKIGAVYSFAEHHMELRTNRLWDMSSLGGDGLHIIEASAKDLDTLTRLTTASFGGSEESAKQRITHDMENPFEQFYIARLDATPISMLKIIDAANKASIYAFSVLPEHRRRGYGKQVLAAIINAFIAKGRTQFALEVETNNFNAIALYEACGFQTTTTYEYFKLRNA